MWQNGPFNLWSLKQWGKSAVALLGTGTDRQYELLSKLKCEGYVLCLDADEAGRGGTYKLGKYLERKRKIVYVVDMLNGKDVNDLTQEQFANLYILTFLEWKHKYHFNF